MVPVWLSFAARLGLGWSGRLERVATARNTFAEAGPAGSSSADPKSAGNPTSATTPATTPCYEVMTSMDFALQGGGSHGAFTCAFNARDRGDQCG
jgi:hypothetical protein